MIDKAIIEYFIFPLYNKIMGIKSDMNMKIRKTGCSSPVILTQEEKAKIKKKRILKNIPFPFIGKEDEQGNVIDPQRDIPDTRIHLEYADETTPWYSISYKNDCIGTIWEEQDGFVVQGRKMPHMEYDYIVVARGYKNPTDAVKKLIEHQTRLLEDI